MKICARPTTQLRCPFCHDSVEAADARICPACSSAQHPACDLAHGGCAVCVVYTKRVRSQGEPRARRLVGSRRWGEGFGRAKGYGSVALVLFLATIVSACLLPLTLISPSYYPSVWTLSVGLGCLLSAGGSFLFLIASVFSRRRARRRARTS